MLTEKFELGEFYYTKNCYECDCSWSVYKCIRFTAKGAEFRKVAEFSHDYYRGTYSLVVTTKEAYNPDLTIKGKIRVIQNCYNSPDTHEYIYNTSTGKSISSSSTHRLMYLFMNNPEILKLAKEYIAAGKKPGVYTIKKGE